MSSKLNIGSVIWNATTGVEQGDILHSNALKTVNGTSLVGSGDTSVLSTTLIGSTTATSATFSFTNLAQFKFLLFQYTNNSQRSSIHVNDATFIGNRFVDTTTIGQTDQFNFTIDPNSISLTQSRTMLVQVYGVK
jgi:hypothetical protein